MQIGARIRQLRLERHLSQEALAHELNVTRQAVTKWENHTALPSTANLLALCALFGVSMEALTAPERNAEPHQPPAPPQPGSAEHNRAAACDGPAQRDQSAEREDPVERDHPAEHNRAAACNGPAQRDQSAERDRPPKRANPARWIFLGLTIALALLFFLALGHALDSAPPQGVIGYADVPTEIYVTGVPLDVCLFAGATLLCLALTILCFCRRRRRERADG